MHPNTKNNGRKTYLREVNPEAEALFEKMIDFLHANNLFFYTLVERSEGSSRYVDVHVSIKLS